MKIQQQNSYNPNMKALYFTKVRPIVAEAVKYKNQKVTQNGIKYVEDTSAKLTPIMREAFEENRFIKNADTQEFNLDMNRTVYVAITNYMITGGDNFPNKLGILGSNEISDNLNNSFKEALSEGKCTIQANSYSLNTEDILKHNLVKRIYYIPSADDTEDHRKCEACD